MYPYFDLALAVLFRWACGLGGYSGRNKPPMFGDYEAQRHWMEVTYQLPIEEWYRNSTNNNLTYWGLDYPPLTAYHSWLLGFIAQQINTTWVDLNVRGVESYEHKLFMRYTVLASDLLTFLPAITLFISLLYVNKKQEDIAAKRYALLTCLLYPGFLLIDYGHFQYNCVSLGLFVAAVAALETNRNLLGSIFFCLALNYKQLELYHAMPFFCYLLGCCIFEKNEWRLWKLTKIGVVVLLTFGVVWLPFLLQTGSAADVLHRLFPFARGLYEDKVANVWCSLSVVIKFKHLLSVDKLLALCSATTMIALLPSAVMLLLNPTKKQFRLSLVISALVFFLFSFHVHEKGILLVVTPVLMATDVIPPASIMRFLIISVISMHPLFVKDETQLSFFALTAAYTVLLWANFHTIRVIKPYEIWWISVCSVVGMGICAAGNFLPPPTKYPDLYSLLISVYSCAHFLFLLLRCYLVQYGMMVQHLATKAGKKRI